jgi:hypothetical protein
MCNSRYEVEKKKKKFNWAKYGNGRVGRGRPCYPPKGMVLLVVLMFRMSLSEREYVNWLKTNVWQIELAELSNPPDRRSIKRVFENKARGLEHSLRRRTGERTSKSCM